MGIEYPIRQKEARTLTQIPAVWTLVLVQLNTSCLVFRYTITMGTKSQYYLSIVAGPVRVILSKFTNYIIIIESVNSICIEIAWTCNSCMIIQENEFAYRSAIVGTKNRNATELVEFLEEWVNSEPTLQVDQFELWVDTRCPY